MEKELILDKSDWQLVTLQEVVKEVRESTKDPIGDGVIHIVGLEHIDSEDIHLRRSAGIEESTTFTKKFSPGDVLFGRRRAYLKKAAQATFGGICSGDITVMRVRDGQLLPELLPFLINNDKFFDYAVKHSAGGLSPRVKFKDLANYEFLLPPKDQQAQLAELLWAMDAVLEREREAKSHLGVLKTTMLKEMFLTSRRKEGQQQDHIAYVKLGTLIDRLETGPCVKYSPDSIGMSLPSILKTSAVSSTTFDPTECYVVLETEVQKLRTYVRKNSIIISRINTAELVGASAYVKEDYPNLFLPDRLWQTVISKNDIIHVKWLSYMLTSPYIRNRISSLCAGTSNSMKYITKEIFLSIKVPLPSISQQHQDVEILDAVVETLEGLSIRAQLSKSLLRSLINQIF